MKALCLPIILCAGNVIGFATTPIRPVPDFADARAATVEVRITPDHTDWTYATGEPVQFTIRVIADEIPVPTLQLEVGHAYPPEQHVAVQAWITQFLGLL